MGQGLYDTQPVFRAAMQECDTLFQPHLNASLLELLYGKNASEETLAETQYTQPALFAIEYALYRLWRSWGVTPDLVAGHSIGEYAAAYAAGVLALEDAVKLVAARGRLMGRLPSGGRMEAVMASEERILPLLKPYQDQVALAAVNAPQSLVLSGEDSALETLLQELDRQGIQHKPLKVSHAFHSPRMEPMLAEFEHRGEECDLPPGADRGGVDGDGAENSQRGVERGVVLGEADSQDGALSSGGGEFDSGRGGGPDRTGSDADSERIGAAERSRGRVALGAFAQEGGRGRADDALGVGTSIWARRGDRLAGL